MNTLVGSDTKTAAPRLPVLNRYLTVWILAAMAVGLALGRMVPGLGTALAGMSVAGVSVPIAFGLLVMMYPPLAKVRYDRLGTVTGDRRLMVASLVMNWIVGPAVMFALAWLFLADLPEYRTGVIIVGLARCIAMVIVWNDLACGDREAAAVLVALNAVFQIVAFGALSWFYLVGLPGWLGWEQAVVEVTFTDISLSVLVFLGVPLLAGYLTRRLSEWLADGTGMSLVCCRSWGRGTCTGCCSLSWRCLPCKARRSPLARGMWLASRFRCCCTSCSCGARRCSWPVCGGSAILGRSRWPSPRQATILSLRLR